MAFITTARLSPMALGTRNSTTSDSHLALSLTGSTMPHANPVPRQYLGSSPSLSGRLLGRTERQTAVIPVAFRHTGASWRSSPNSSPHPHFQGPRWLPRCRISSSQPQHLMEDPPNSMGSVGAPGVGLGQQRGWLGTGGGFLPGTAELREGT